MCAKLFKRVERTCASQLVFRSLHLDDAHRLPAAAMSKGPMRLLFNCRVACKIVLAFSALLLLLWPLLYQQFASTAQLETSLLLVKLHNAGKHHTEAYSDVKASVPHNMLGGSAGSSSSSQRRKSGNKEFRSTSCVSGQSVSGVSGSVFLGSRQRSYNGPRLFDGVTALPPSSSIASATGGIGINTTRAQGLRYFTKWAVCTTIFKPSDAILRMVQLDGWAVVIVGDKGGAPFSLSAPSVVFLDAAAQESFLTAIDHSLKQLLPWKHFGRKNVGYLYAIAHGAEMIWDFDDDNILQQGVVPMVPTSDVYHVQVSSSACEAINPYPFMGDPSSSSALVPPSWPRGLPLDLIRAPCSCSLAPGSSSSVAVVQSLANHDPDVDGIYRLTRGVPFNFDASSRKTLVMPEGALAPWNAQATLVLHPALWALLLPVTVHGRVSDIWRSYVAQRLLWDIGYRVAFAPPMVDQFRSPHNYLADMQAEEHLYYRSGQLVKLLREWRGTAPTLPGRYEELMIELYTRDYIQLQDVHLAQHWLLALSAASYTFPPLIPSSLAAEPKLHSVLNSASRDHPTADKAAHLGRKTDMHAVRWAVTTTTRPPSQAIKQLAALDGWKVVMVADIDTPSDWSWQNVVVLTVEDQEKLEFSIVKHLKWSNAAANDCTTATAPLAHSQCRRKSIGYLYAIAHGAQVIYDVGDTNELLQQHIPVLTCSDGGSEIADVVSADPCLGLYTLLDTNGSIAEFNPHPLFGQPQLQLQGVPTPACERQLQDDQFCFQRRAARPLIQQGLTNGMPAANSMLPGTTPFNVTFDQAAFSVVLPQGVMSPFDSFNTLFLRDALWALLIPVDAQPQTTAILRSYWSQRLLWDIGGHFAVLPASTVNRHAGTCYNACSRSRDVNSTELLHDLVSMSPAALSLPDRMLETAAMMVTKGHWTQQHLAMMRAWIEDLHNLGYTFPDVVSNKATAGSQLPKRGPSAPGLDPRVWLKNGSLEHSFVFMSRWCVQMDKIAVVNFNRLGEYSGSIEQIGLLYAAYKPLFRQVCFLGDYGPQPVGHLSKLIEDGRAYNCHEYYKGMPTTGGFLAYACLAGALSAWQATWSAAKGGMPHVLYVNDDVLFSPCAVSQLNSSKIWYTHDVSITRHKSLQQSWHWDGTWGSNKDILSAALLTALQEVYGSMASRVASRLQYGNVSVTEGQADFFYLPSRFYRGYIELAYQLRGHYIISEVAVPNILGLIIDSVADVELASLCMAWPWDAQRTCLVENVSSIMPLGMGMNYTAVHQCVGDHQYYAFAKSIAPLRVMFGAHAYKLSNANVTAHWLKWWASQAC